MIHGISYREGCYLAMRCLLLYITISYNGRCNQVIMAVHCRDTHWWARIKGGACGLFRIGCECQGDFGDGQLYLSHIGGCTPDRVV
jgi:hypothetical protein